MGTGNPLHFGSTRFGDKTLSLRRCRVENMAAPDDFEAKGIAALRGTWRLVCVAAAGRLSEDVVRSEVVLPFLRVDGGSCQAVRVGREMQPIGWWEELVHDAGLRKAVSRDHFEVRVDVVGGRQSGLSQHVEDRDSEPKLEGAPVEEVVGTRG